MAEIERTPAIAVIIAAYHAEDTIGTAVASALAQEEVAEVVVVDDASSDGTADEAEAAGRGDPRLRVLRQAANRGPSAARNRAISETEAPYLAILDADDAYLPGRFAPMLALDGWDFCADNVIFVKGDPLGAEVPPSAKGSTRHGRLGFAAFVAGNIGDWRVKRGELGFLKPVMRRAFLEGAGLRYGEGCRLGEDFLLYAEALAREASFLIIENCGYAAVERANSLSGLHATDDLRALRAGDDELLEKLDLTAADRHILQVHRQSIHEKIAHREVLEIKRNNGLATSLLALTKRPTALRDIVRDKLAPAPLSPQSQRLLLPEAEFTRMIM